MPDIITLISTGRVVAIADNVVQHADRYAAATGASVMDLPFNSFPEPTELKKGVESPPADLVVGYNYNYVDGAYVDSGVPVPPPLPEPEPPVDEDDEMP